jgi:hypothetical protein
MSPAYGLYRLHLAQTNRNLPDRQMINDSITFSRDLRDEEGSCQRDSSHPSTRGGNRDVLGSSPERSIAPAIDRCKSTQPAFADLSAAKEPPLHAYLKVFQSFNQEQYTSSAVYCQIYRCKGVHARFVRKGTAVPCRDTAPLCPSSRRLSPVPAGEVRRGDPPHNPFSAFSLPLLCLRTPDEAENRQVEGLKERSRMEGSPSTPPPCLSPEKPILVSGPLPAAAARRGERERRRGLGAAKPPPPNLSLFPPSIPAAGREGEPGGMRGGNRKPAGALSIQPSGSQTSPVAFVLSVMASRLAGLGGPSAPIR